MSESFLQPMGEIADAQRTHLVRVVLITLLALIPVFIGLPYILSRYRLGTGRGTYRPNWTFSKPLEFLIWGLPVAIVLTLAFWLWHSTTRLDPYKQLGPSPLEVQVVGLDWKWLFIYPEEGVVTVNELVIPVDRPVELTMTTDTVMQSLLIAPLAGQIYSMPGMTTKLNFVANRSGTAEGENTQFNGEGFGRQKFIVRAVEDADYADWISQPATGPVVNDDIYVTLRRQTSMPDLRSDLGLERSAEPLRLGLADRNLFNRIVSKYHERGDPTVLGGTGAPPSQSPGGIE